MHTLPYLILQLQQGSSPVSIPAYPPTLHFQKIGMQLSIKKLLNPFVSNAPATPPWKTQSYYIVKLRDLKPWSRFNCM